MSRQAVARRQILNVAVAKARLPELIERAANGEEIILARHGKPRARLMPLDIVKKYVFGAGKGKWKGAERVLDLPLPADFLDAFDPPKSR